MVVLAENDGQRAKRYQHLLIGLVAIAQTMRVMANRTRQNSSHIYTGVQCQVLAELEQQVAATGQQSRVADLIDWTGNLSGQCDTTASRCTVFSSLASQGSGEVAAVGR